MAVTEGAPVLALMLRKIAECLCAAVNPDGDFCYCGVMLGQQANPLGMLNCKERPCGVAWVRPAASYPSSGFSLPDEQGSGRSARSPLALQIEVGVARCYPQPSGREMFVAPEKLAETADTVLTDMVAMRSAILCCIPKNDPAWAGRQVELGEWQPLPADGRVAGGVWSAWIG